MRVCSLFAGIGEFDEAYQTQEDFDITQFHSCNDSLYWHGCYGPETAWKKYVTPESYSHPAKMSFLLCNRIFKHLKALGLLNASDTICDFMAGSGRTNIVASLHGFDSVAVELEPHFIKMINDNTALVRKQINRDVNIQVIQGDSRKLSEILQRANVGIVSPPYQNSISGGKSGIEWQEDWGKPSESRQPSQNIEYGNSKQNIGNLKDKQLVGITSPPYSEADDRISKGKIQEGFIKDCLSRTYDKTNAGKRNDNIANLPDKNLVGITSPPYESADNMFHDIKWINKVRPRPSNPKVISEVENDIESQRGESYLSAMLQVYQEASKIMPVIVTVTKNPTRTGKLRRLDLDTAKLLMMAGYKIIDYHRAVLFDEKKQLTLKGNVRKELKGRLSFFKRLSVAKGNVAARHEDVIFAIRKDICDGWCMT